MTAPLKVSRMDYSIRHSRLRFASLATHLLIGRRSQDNGTAITDLDRTVAD